MHKIGEKFVIEIGDIIDGFDTGSPQYIIKGFDKLIFDDKGLKRLQSLDSSDIEIVDFVWNIAHDIMELPITERAKIFNVSKNRTSFKELSEKFSFEEALKKYNEYLIDKDRELREEEIKDDVVNLCAKYSCTFDEIKEIFMGEK